MTKDKIYQDRFKALREREEFKSFLLKKDIGELKSNEQVMQEAKVFSENKTNQWYFQYKKNLERDKKQEKIKLAKQFAEKLKADREREERDRGH